MQKLCWVETVEMCCGFYALHVSYYVSYITSCILKSVLIAEPCVPPSHSTLYHCGSFYKTERPFEETDFFKFSIKNRMSHISDCMFVFCISGWYFLSKTAKEIALKSGTSKNIHSFSPFFWTQPFFFTLSKNNYFFINLQNTIKYCAFSSGKVCLGVI